MRLLICGSRTWTAVHPIAIVINGYRATDNQLMVIHGGHWEGADALADQHCLSVGLAPERFNADWKRHGRKAGPIRNEVMLEVGKPDVVWAFRMPGQSNGTDHMASIAQRAHVPTFVVRGDNVESL